VKPRTDPEVFSGGQNVSKLTRETEAMVLVLVPNNKTNSVALVRERTIPIERPPLLGDVSTNFCGLKVSRGHCNGSLRPYSRFSRPIIYFLDNFFLF
jgi:hypothetical protein